MIYGTTNAVFDVVRSNLFITKTVKEILFDGYRVKELDTFSSLGLPMSIMGVSVPSRLPNNTFALFYNRNGTKQGPFEVYTGVGKTSDKYTNVVAWKNKRSLSYWTGDHCNAINGTDGGQFPPYVSKKKNLYVFSVDMCR